MDISDSDRVYDSGFKQLIDGQDEAIISEAEKTKKQALAVGNQEIAAKAQAIIDDIIAKHQHAEDAHQVHHDARQELLRAKKAAEERSAGADDAR